MNKRKIFFIIPIALVVIALSWCVVLIVKGDNASYKDGAVTAVITVAATPADNASEEPAYTDNPASETTGAYSEPPDMTIIDETAATDSVSKAQEPVNDPPEIAQDDMIPEETFVIAEQPAYLADNGIIISGNRGLMIYGGNFEQGERYAKALNTYKEQLENVNVYGMVAPTAIEFYCPDSFRSMTGDQRANINRITENLSGVLPVNAYSALAARFNEDIFLRTDHHWAPLGAYYAARAFCDKAEVASADLSEYDKVEIEGYVGTLYGFSNDETLKNNPESFVYYKPRNIYTTTYYNIDNIETPIVSTLFINQPVSQSYSTFMGGDAKITHIKTDVKNNRRLAVIKDSYGNALVPFLTGSFEEIYVIDMRYFPYNGVDYMKEKGVTDLLFCNNIFMANTGLQIMNLEKILIN